MNDVVFSAHARDMLLERNISEEWVSLALEHPDKKSIGEDGNIHYHKAIKEREHRVLHVVVNQEVHPGRIVTCFFDRRLMR